MKPVLSVRSLSKTFPATRHEPPFTAVDRVSFSLAEGEILGLLGPNGAGKSTTIAMLLGVLTPTEGTITYFGKDLSLYRSEILGQVTFASTYIKFPWRLTVLENLKIYGLLYGLSSDVFYTRAEKFLSEFGVWEQRTKTLNNLSAGQITRVMLAKAFIPHPKVVLLDEPTASLDPDIAHQIRVFVMNQQKAFGTSILYTSHNMDEVSEVCDRVMFLRNGRIVAVDTPENLASSVSVARLRLQVADGLKRVRAYAASRRLSSEVDGREIVIDVDEQMIAGFLAQLAHEGIRYTQVSIDKPTLEDYFLSMSRRGRKG